MSLQEIAEVVGGTLRDVPDRVVVMRREAVIDSREATPGSLFVALAGEHTDGHRYAEEAVAHGAVGVLATRPVGVPAVLVPDVLQALTALARAVLAKLDAPTVIGVTGSCGKTSTKDLLAQLLEAMGSTTATPRSFNHRIGVPLTVLRADADTRYLVTELGAGRPGDIAYLAGIAPPAVGLVTNVGSAHLGTFGGTRQAVAAAKGELVEALPPDGLAVLNADDPYVRQMAARTAARVLTFGRAPDADVRVTGLRLDRLGRPSFTVAHRGQVAEVRLRLYGEHQAANAVAAAAVALGLGAELQLVAEGLRNARQLTRSRMELSERSDGVTIVNDAFNANPESMAAAVAALSAMADGHPRRIAVLGEMLELGDGSPAHHAELGRRVAAAGVTDLIAVGGPDAELMHRQALARGVTSTLVPDRAAALDLLRGYLEPGDLVLLKGSHATGLEETARQLAGPEDLAGGTR